jgi:serine kinase
MPRESSELESRGIYLQKKIGSGNFSNVYSASWKVDEHKKVKVAVKIMQLDKLHDERIYEFVAREMDIIKKIKHPNLASTIDILSIGRSIVMIGTLYECDLLQYIEQRGRISERVARRLLIELVAGVKYLHDMDIAHRDLKIENLLLSANGTLKLGDFGFARFVSPTGLCDTRCGSAGYIAPEVTVEADEGIDAKLADIWSIGVVLYTMITNSFPFDNKDYIWMNKNKSVVIKFPNSRAVVSGRLRSLIEQFLMFEPTKRINLIDAPKHPWITDYNQRGSQNSTKSTANSDISK